MIETADEIVVAYARPEGSLGNLLRESALRLKKKVVRFK